MVLLLESGLSFVERKVQLEARIKGLEEERGTLLSVIPILKEKLTSLRLEGSAKSLESEVSSLQSEKSILEDEIARLGQSPIDTPSQTSEGQFPQSSPSAGPNGQAF